MVISMDRWKDKVAVVTGASAGIGAAIVEKLVEEGLVVVGLARRKEKIEALREKLQGKAGKLHAVAVDITKEEDILRAFKWIKENVGPVHVLVNNAGIARVTDLIEGDTKLWKEVLDTNIMGLCIATREAVKDMRANNVDGHIIHISSIVAHLVPTLEHNNVYPASKHAVRALTETLRQELNSIGSKIKMSSISPGLVFSEIFEATAVGSGRPYLKERKEEFLKTAKALKTVDVADAVVYVLATPPHVQSISPGLVFSEIFEATAVGSGRPYLKERKEEFLKTAKALKTVDVADAVVYVLATPPHVQVHELIIKPIGERF